MDTKEYIKSGILELYIAGALTEKENQEVYAMMQAHPEIKEEVLQIETAVSKLMTSLAPVQNGSTLTEIQSKLNFDKAGKIIQMPDNKPTINWFTYSGWAAAIIFGGALFFMFQQNREANFELEVSSAKNAILEQQIADSRNDLNKTRDLVNTLRDKNIEVTTLGGQAIAPDAYAKVFWNQEDGMAYIDVAGLPEPPPGKVYQVWSLTLNPLSPTSLGTLDDFTTDENKIFALANTNDSQAFGITLEPAGGSESPTLEQLYTLGVIKA